MTRAELIEKIARAIAEMEGFYATAAKPTLAQRNANPGNIRQWRDGRGRQYPTSKGYVDLFPGTTSLTCPVSGPAMVAPTLSKCRARSRCKRTSSSR
ncbi:MAG: hypothetical protein HUU41_04165 [Bryobacteraceae bacterium]|nr:hypothetical protein [Bryobacteraceae bacterium]